MLLSSFSHHPPRTLACAGVPPTGTFLLYAVIALHSQSHHIDYLLVAADINITLNFIYTICLLKSTAMYHINPTSSVFRGPVKWTKWPLLLSNTSSVLVSGRHLEKASSST